MSNELELQVSKFIMIENMVLTCSRLKVVLAMRVRRPVYGRLRAGFLNQIGLASASNSVAKVRTCGGAKSGSNGVSVTNFVTQNTTYDTAS